MNSFFKPRNSSQKGFTLIEILAVMFIISIFVSIGVVVANSGREKARDNERKVTLERLKVALELYRDKVGMYPCTASYNAGANTCTGSMNYFSSEPGDVIPNNSGNWIPGLAPTYINALPRDPLGGASDLPACVGGSWKRAYAYASDGINYVLWSHCAPERPIATNDPYKDPVRLVDNAYYAYKVSTPGAATW